MTTETENQTFVDTKLIYLLLKSVPKKIHSVTALQGGVLFTFIQGTDYVLIENNLVWTSTSAGIKPDNNTSMEIIYDYTPNLTEIPFTEEQYGRDLKLFNDDIRGAPSGDIDIQKFSRNVLDALRHRLLTDKGELWRHPYYGSELNKLLGENINETTIELARLYVVECVNQDPRVEEIVEVVITPNYSERALRIEIIFITIVNREQMNLIYDFFLDKDDENKIYE